MTTSPHPAYLHAIHRVEQLLTCAAMTEVPANRTRYRDDAAAIADEWAFPYEMRRELMAAAHENAYCGRPPITHE